MQNRTEKTKSGCPECGMMSFPSNDGTFSNSKETSKKIEATSKEPKAKLKDCPECGMMSFPSKGPSK